MSILVASRVTEDFEGSSLAQMTTILRTPRSAFCIGLCTAGFNYVVVLPDKLIVMFVKTFLMYLLQLKLKDGFT